MRTKLFIPRLKGGMVPRARVSDRLDAAAKAKLVVISAPAGFGKTTAVAAWLERVPDSLVAWLSLDEGDHEVVAFWTSVMGAVRAVVPEVRDGVVESLQSARPPFEPLLTAALNELSELDRDLLSRARRLPPRGRAGGH